MTWEEYFEACKERWEETDKTSREAIHEYNEWRRELRRQVCEEEEEKRANQAKAAAAEGQRAQKR